MGFRALMARSLSSLADCTRSREGPRHRTAPACVPAISFSPFQVPLSIASSIPHSPPNLGEPIPKFTSARNRPRVAVKVHSNDDGAVHPPLTCAPALPKLHVRQPEVYQLSLLTYPTFISSTIVDTLHYHHPSRFTLTSNNSNHNTDPLRSQYPTHNSQLDSNNNSSAIATTMVRLRRGKTYTNLRLTSRPFDFLALPLELRIMVYEWLLVNGRCSIVPMRTLRRGAYARALSNNAKIDVAIFTACKFISAEAMKAFFNRAHFMLRSRIAGGIHTLVYPKHLLHMRHIRLEFAKDIFWASAKWGVRGSFLEQGVKRALGDLAEALKGRRDVKALEVVVATCPNGLPLNATSPDLGIFEPLRQLRVIRRVKLVIRDLEELYEVYDFAWVAAKKSALEQIERAMMGPVETEADAEDAKRDRKDGVVELGNVDGVEPLVESLFAPGT
jgi:hypothetical protein